MRERDLRVDLFEILQRFKRQPRTPWEDLETDIQKLLDVAFARGLDTGYDVGFQKGFEAGANGLQP